MKVLGFNLFGRKAAVEPMSSQNTGGAALSPVRSNTLFGFIAESFAGAWQKNITVDNDHALLAFSAVYACVSLIANDIGKLRIKLMETGDSGVSKEVFNHGAFGPVLTKPNHYQNRIQFITHWIVSKLLHGNTYILKERDYRKVVVGMYILDPRLVTPLVAQSGEVYYQLNTDYLSLVKTPLAAIPASEIIHDRMLTLWHPLMGVSPIYACGSSATQGVRIQNNSAHFFENMSRPSGQLTAPGFINDATAERLKKDFEERFGGDKVGRLFVSGDGLKYESIAVNAVDAQLIEQLKWTVEDVARCFHVPLHMIGSGPNPTFQNIGALTQAYYSQTLQSLIESLELCLTDGLALPSRFQAELDLEPLLRMDTNGRYESYARGIGSGWMAPNEARVRENYDPVEGGEWPVMQQQNHSLATLAKLDEMLLNPPAPPTTGFPGLEGGGGGEAGPPPSPNEKEEEPTKSAATDAAADEDDPSDADLALLVAKLITKFAEAPNAIQEH